MASEKQETPPFFTKRFHRRVWLTIVVVGLSVATGGVFTLHASWPSRVRRGYEPEQPIAFSHELHAGVMGIGCRYCHVGAERGAHATVPELAICMNCHGVFEGDPEKEGQVEKIRVLLDAFENGRPVLWNKVYDLADFAYFDHSRHTLAGLDCRNCHGAVETMAVVRKETPLTMGWCLDCHMGRLSAPWPLPKVGPASADGVVLDADSYLPGRRGAEIVRDPIFRDILAPIHCSTCHR